ncbi:hypothetical protein AA103581_2126 [Gluconobacter wancherniae NBRC 103581]|nr:hypothetical protein AA103581_2126 [Gluconobacter wancherniae NBRC 103581]
MRVSMKQDLLDEDGLMAAGAVSLFVHYKFSYVRSQAKPSGKTGTYRRMNGILLWMKAGNP